MQIKDNNILVPLKRNMDPVRIYIFNVISDGGDTSKHFALTHLLQHTVIRCTLLLLTGHPSTAQCNTAFSEEERCCAYNLA